MPITVMRGIDMATKYAVTFEDQCLPASYVCVLNADEFRVLYQEFGDGIYNSFNGNDATSLSNEGDDPKEDVRNPKAHFDTREEAERAAGLVRTETNTVEPGTVKVVEVEV